MVPIPDIHGYSWIFRHSIWYSPKTVEESTFSGSTVVGSAELRSSSDIEFLSTSWLSSSPASLPTSDLHQPQFAVAVRTRFTQPILKLSNCSSATWSSSLAFSSEHGEPLGCLLTSYAGSSNSGYFWHQESTMFCSKRSHNGCCVPLLFLAGYTCLAMVGRWHLQPAH